MMGYQEYSKDNSDWFSASFYSFDVAVTAKQSMVTILLLSAPFLSVCQGVRNVASSY